tara:strand:+ start:1430 stop:2269 length:840 start_codon:yes stop_codon:yes gene_type:complete
MSVKVYGFTHSPWVQAVLLALHDQGIEYDLFLRPPLKVFRKWGVYMPAISINDGPWEIESTEILIKLGYEPISIQEITAANSAWQGVLHRTDNPFNFFLSFSRGGQVSKSFMSNTTSNFLLSFVAFYMFTLISIGKLTLKQKEPNNFGDQFMYWENLIDSSDGPFIDGNKPGSKDMIMFGMVQCHASIPVPALDALLNDKRLQNVRKWISKMQDYFSEYPYLYSAKFFQSSAPEANSANFFQIVVFFLGLLIMFLAFPITIPLVLILMGRVEQSRIKKF